MKVAENNSFDVFVCEFISFSWGMGMGISKNRISSPPFIYPNKFDIYCRY